MRVRAARLADVPAIHALIERFVPQGILLPRSREAIERDLEHFLVAVEDREYRAEGPTLPRVVGCVSLDTYEPLAQNADGNPFGLAEIRSLAVAAEFQGNGLGARLVAAAVRRAKRLKIARLFAVTHSLAFFEKQGFEAIALDGLPEKIARDCCRCPRQGWCGQQGVMKILQPATNAELFSRSRIPTLRDRDENRNSLHEPREADSPRAQFRPPALPAATSS